MKLLIPLLFAGFVFSNAWSYGQITSDTLFITPGDPRLRGDFIAPYTNTWKMYTENLNGDLDETGVWIDTVRISNAEGETILERIQTVNYNSGVVRKHYDKISRNSLAPIEVRVVNISGDQIDTVINVRYKDKNISGSRYFNIDGTGNIPEIKADFSFTLESPVFDWHLWGILISSLPLEENFSARMLTHSSPGYNNAPFLWVTATVIGSETIETPVYGPVECWKVSVKAEAPWTFWISKVKAVPPIVQIKIRQPDGTFQWWK